MKNAKYIYVGIVLLIYIPLVFMGANVFFPKYTGPNSYYQYKECALSVTPGEDRQIDQKCIEEQEQKRIQFETEKNAYNANKYLFIVLIALVSLGIISLLKLDNSINLGVFLGAAITTFVSTLMYLQTASKLGFGVLVLVFILTVYCINKNKKSFL